MTQPRDASWLEANQRLLVAEFARLRALLGDGKVEDAAQAVAEARAGLAGASAVDQLTELFGLSNFERDLVLLLAGVEMDAGIAALCARGTGSAQRVTYALAMATLPEPHWNAIAPAEPLRHARLIEIEEGFGLTHARLRLAERVLHFLAGVDAIDEKLIAVLEPVDGAGPMSETHEKLAHDVARRCASSRRSVVLLAGDDAAGQVDVGATIAAQLGLRLHRLRAIDVPRTAGEQCELAALWLRESALAGSALFVEQDEEPNPALARFVERIAGLVIVAGRDLPAMAGERCRVDRPEVAERRQLWESALGTRARSLNGRLDGLASQYRLGARRIVEIARQTARDPNRGLEALCRIGIVASHSMPTLAQRIETHARWPDLVLPDAQLAMLRQIGVHARQKFKVHHAWEFAGKSARGLGIATLFWGESGTGKTLAAEVLANELGADLYRVDLSAVVSKYIGETEKNLRRLFDAAEETGAMLLFDEADALFGKRSEVKDSHDRYANIEVSYLLQRMESYPGLAILTTNHKAALDAAFQRRLRFIVHFPFPDAQQREVLWRTVFPGNTPVSNLDYQKLALLNVSGGTIRNVALGAAFLAAEHGTPVCMTHLLQATRLDSAKRDRPYSEAETRGWA